MAQPPSDWARYQRSRALYHAGRRQTIAVGEPLIESRSGESPGFVPLVCVVELSWVLSSAYGLDRGQLVQALEALLRTKELVVERAETVWKALRVFQSGHADLADCLIERSAASAGCDKTMTFDRGAVKGCGMTLVIA